MYCTENESLAFFDDRLHASAWENAATSDRQKALKQASALLDTLVYAGERAAAYTARLAQVAAGTCPVDEAAIAAAGLTQEHAFPRGTDTVIPTALKNACCLIAYALLVDGVNVEEEFATLGIESEGHSSIRVNYQRDRVAPHVAAGIPSFEAWKLIVPFLGDTGELRLNRVS